MYKLLTYESFVPKNLEKREKDLAAKIAKEILAFQPMIDDFHVSLGDLQGLEVKDPLEQLFVDQFKYLKILTDQRAFPWTIFLSLDERILFAYYFQDNSFRVYYNIFNEFRKIIKNKGDDAIVNYMFKYFNLKPTLINYLDFAVKNNAEKYFPIKNI